MDGFIRRQIDRKKDKLKLKNGQNMKMSISYLYSIRHFSRIIDKKVEIID